MTIIINGLPAAVARVEFDTLTELNGLFIDGTTLDTDSATRTPESHAINGPHTGYGDSVTKSVGTGAGDVAVGTARADAEATAAADATAKANAAAAASDPVGSAAAAQAASDPVGSAAAAQAASDPAGSAAAAQAASDPVGSAAAAEAASDPVGTATAAVGAHDILAGAHGGAITKANSALQPGGVTHAATTGQSATDHHSNASDPTADQKAALAGTGTPAVGDPYVSDSDARNTNARTPTAHTINSHTVGVVGAQYFPMNVGGTIVSSSGQVARAGVMQGLTYVQAGSNTLIYGASAWGGLANGGLLYNSYNGPTKFVNTGIANAADAIANAIVYDANLASIDDEMILCSTGWTDNGDTYYHRSDVMDLSMSIPAEATGSLPAVADHTSEIAVATDGDDSGPALVVCDGALWRPVIQKPKDKWLVPGAKLVWDGTRWVTGFKDAADNTIDAIWTDQTGASSVAKSSGVTTFTVANGTGSDWGNGVYTAARLEGVVLPRYSDWEVWVHKTDDGVNDQGAYFGVLFEDTDADFVLMQSLRSAGNNLILAYNGPNNVLYNAAVGATATWLKLSYYGGVVHYLYFNGAIGTDPTDAQWVEVATHATAAGWAPVNLTLQIGALNFAGLPGCTIDFGRVTVQLK